MPVSATCRYRQDLGFFLSLSFTTVSTLNSQMVRVVFVFKSRKDSVKNKKLLLKQRCTCLTPGLHNKWKFFDKYFCYLNTITAN